MKRLNHVARMARPCIGLRSHTILDPPVLDALSSPGVILARYWCLGKMLVFLQDEILYLL